MVQEFHVVRCFSCETFQVQQVKKVNKWSCKVCGQKQSVLKEFGRGSGADCRRHVQKLNAARGAKMEEQDDAKRAKMEAQSLWEPAEFDEEEQLQHKPASRWDKYLSARHEEVTQEEVEPEEAVVMDRDQLSFRKPRPRRPEPYKNYHSSGNTKKRPTEKQDVSRPHNSATIPTTPSIPTTSNNTSIPTTSNNTSIPSVCPGGVVSKWSAFLDNPRVSEPRSGFSLFQTEEDLDLDLNWD